MDLQAHHIPLQREHTQGNDGAGRFFFLPGSEGRARRIAQHFAGTEVLESDRQLNVYLGKLEANDIAVDVGVVSTGMGCPSLDIVVTELIGMGAKHFLRVGTAGSLQPHEIQVGSLVVASGAVRHEGTSARYITPEYPSMADPLLVAALRRAAHNLNVQHETYEGIVHSKDSLYGVEMSQGPLAQENHAYMKALAEMGVLATEMECAHLFVLSDVYTNTIRPLAQQNLHANIIRSSGVMAVIGDGDAFSADHEAVQRTEQKAIDLALEAALELHRYHQQKLQS